MGSAQENLFPGGAGDQPDSGGSSTTIQTFNGIKAIQEHLDHIARLKDYLCARTKVVPDIPLTCYTECQVSQWLSKESGEECANFKLIDTTCKRCEEFHAVAAQAVLRTEMDLPEPIQDVLQAAQDFENASSLFQAALAELHIECKLNQ